MRVVSREVSSPTNRLVILAIDRYTPLKEQVNASGDIALHEAVMFGEKEVAEVMLKREMNLVSVRNKSGETPLYVAAANGKKEVLTLLTEYLSDCMTTRDDGCTILHAAMMGEYYYLALTILESYPDLALKRDKNGLTALHWLATTPSSFPSWSQHVLKNLGRANFILVQIAQIIIYFYLPLVEEIDDEKQKHIVAIALAKNLLEEAKDWSHYTSIEETDTGISTQRMSKVPDPLMLATKHGIDELAIEILNRYPEAANSLDEKGDVPNLRPGAMEHMIWDALWFERVRHDSNPRILRQRNSKGKTVGELYEERHSTLRETAEKAAKDINQVLIIISTLLATVNFAVLFTLPGGFNQGDGHPVLIDNSKRALRLFLFCIGASLFAALFALATLLSIQLSPFHVDDFYFALSMRWLISSTAMFYSTTFTIIACLQTFILEDEMQNLYYVAMFAAIILLCLVYIDSTYICFRHMVELLSVPRMEGEFLIRVATDHSFDDDKVLMEGDAAFEEDDSHSTEGMKNLRNSSIVLPETAGKFDLFRSMEMWTWLLAYALSVAKDIEVVEHVTYKKAIKSMESEQWIVVMSEDIESLYKNQTWELVKPPVSQKIVGCKGIYKKNDGIPGTEDARVLLAMVALHDLELEQLDVEIAFLHGELEVQIFMRQPEGFMIQDKEDRVCLLKKFLHGLKQSPR
ncbi:hypothetical protein RJ639_044976 [Escallonia herrerae]|uniref:PGG domain-containing protein n=1 Tax=Escallonia herrerae TaxID=1293975 RepID=A0AA89B1H1_9ASTE|nr:hypothetical protein RJ639_044976 [Escallonia herrerae]